MIIYNTLHINRMVMHRIVAKSVDEEQATVEYNDTLISIDREIQKILTDRLSQSFGKSSKSFELSIENDGDGSTFSFIKDLVNKNDDEFITISHDIADLLADAQGKKGNVPGGYLLIIDCTNYNSHPVYVIMKAESHNALNIIDNTAEALQNIILSPAQKLYKSAVFEHIGDTDLLTKKDFKVFLFDSQFSSGAKLASYFYKYFLGLTISGNASIETKNFYNLMISTAEAANADNVDIINHIKDQVVSLLTSEATTISPRDVILDIVPEAQRDLYIRKVSNEFEGSFVKDVSLLGHQLNNRTLKLGQGLKLYGPTQLFNNDTITIENDENDPTIKIIKIKTNVDGLEKSDN